MDVARETQDLTTPKRIRDLALCPLRFFFDHVSEMAVPREADPTTPATTDRLVHAALARGARVLSTIQTPIAPSGVRSVLRGALEEESLAVPEGETVDIEALAWAREMLDAAAPRADFPSVKKVDETPLVEEPWLLDCDGALVSGTWDRVDEREGRGIVVVDYRTEPTPRPCGELRLDPEAALQLAAAQDRWPGKRVSLEYRYLVRGTVVLLEWSSALDGWARAVARAHTASLANLTKTGTWRERTGPHCASCPFRVGCEGYQESLHRSGLVDLDDGEELEGLVYHLGEVSSTLKLLEEKKKDLLRLVRPRLERDETIVAGGHEVRLAKRRTPRFPDFRLTLKKIHEATGIPMPELEDALLSIKREAPGRFLASLDDEQRAKAEAALEATGTLDVATWVEVKPILDPFVGEGEGEDGS